MGFASKAVAAIVHVLSEAALVLVIVLEQLEKS